MRYHLLIERHALKQIMKLDKSAINLIKAAIHSLAENPRPYGYIKLKGEDAYRIRVANYRIIYEIHSEKITVIVVAVGHRKDVYKKK